MCTDGGIHPRGSLRGSQQALGVDLALEPASKPRPRRQRGRPVGRPLGPLEPLEVRSGRPGERVRVAAAGALGARGPEAAEQAVLDQARQAALRDPQGPVYQERRELGRHDVAGRRSAWGSETRIPSRSEAVVLVDEPIEQISPASPPIHQLATHDLLAAFLRAGSPEVGEGLVAWVPERPCGELLGVLRPDALAGVRVGQRTLALFLERDLGTERGEVLADKVRRYRSVFSRKPGDAMAVGFVVASDRRAQTIHALGRRQPGGLPLLTVVADQLLVDPLGAAWLDGQQPRSIRELAAAGQGDGPILISGCLLDADAIAAFDDRAASTLSALTPYLRG